MISMIAESVLSRGIRNPTSLPATLARIASLSTRPTNVRLSSIKTWPALQEPCYRFSTHSLQKPHNQRRHRDSIATRVSLPTFRSHRVCFSQTKLRSVGQPADHQSGARSTPKNADDARQRDEPAIEQITTAPLKAATYENIYNLPNLLTVSRLFAAPATAYLLLHDHNQWALALFVYAGLTDLVDGWMARKWNLQTVAGSVIDPMADKALMIILTVTLALKSAIPLSLATLILGRDAALAVAAFYYRYASLPAPKTFMRYWDFSLPSAQVHPTTMSKYNTFLQLILIGGTLALPVVTGVTTFESLGLTSAAADPATGLRPELHTAVVGLQGLVAATTVWSGLSYAFLPRAVTMLGADEALKAKQGARGRAIIGLTFGAVVVAALAIAVSPRDLVRERKDRAAQRRAET